MKWHSKYISVGSGFLVEMWGQDIEPDRINGRDIPMHVFLPDLWESLAVPADLVTTGQILDEVLVMRDDHQLEVPLRRTLVDDVRQCGGKAPNVLAVQVGGGLVQGDDAAVRWASLMMRLGPAADPSTTHWNIYFIKTK